MEQADSLPITTTLSLSAPACFWTGVPPFVVTIKHQSTVSRPLWALVYRFTDWCEGIEIRDLERNGRRGPSLGWLAYAQFDEDPDPREDTSLERLEPGQSLEILYTFDPQRQARGQVRSDLEKLKDGQRYRVVLRKRKWWWAFEDEIPEDCKTDEERRRILGEQRYCEWMPDCVEEFEMVG